MRVADRLSARERYRLERRLERLGRRVDSARGEVMSLNWLHWMDQWLEVHDQLRAAERPLSRLVESEIGVRS